jgi:uncharacterized protein YmfQ (DUF2313 family)
MKLLNKWKTYTGVDHSIFTAGVLLKRRKEVEKKIEKVCEK